MRVICMLALVRSFTQFQHENGIPTSIIDARDREQCTRQNVYSRHVAIWPKELFSCKASCTTPRAYTREIILASRVMRQLCCNNLSLMAFAVQRVIHASVMFARYVIVVHSSSCFYGDKNQPKSFNSTKVWNLCKIRKVLSLKNSRNSQQKK